MRLTTLLATIRERASGSGALLLVCRTDWEGVNGAGSEFEDLVLSI